MTEEMKSRVQAHLTGETPLDAATWREILLAAAGCEGELDRWLVMALQEEPERVWELPDRKLANALWARLFPDKPEGDGRTAWRRRALIEQAQKLHPAPAPGPAYSRPWGFSSFWPVLRGLAFAAGAALVMLAVGTWIAAPPAGPEPLRMAQVDSAPLEAGFPGFSEEFYPRKKLVPRAIPGFGIEPTAPPPGPTPDARPPLKVRLWSAPAAGTGPAAVFLRLSQEAHLLLLLVRESSAGVEAFEAFQMDPGKTRAGDHEIRVPPRSDAGAGERRRLVAIAADGPIDPKLAAAGTPTAASLKQAWTQHLEQRAKDGHQAALDQLDLP